MSLRPTGRTHRRLGAAEVFAAPVLIALASLAGLVVGLVGDGWWDVVAAALLSVTILTLILLRLTGRA